MFFTYFPFATYKDNDFMNTILQAGSVLIQKDV